MKLNLNCIPPALNSGRVWIAAACMVGVLTGCGKKVEASPPLSALPEVNDVNCKHAAIMAMPDNEARQKFASLCARRFDFVPSQPKSYTF